MKLEWSSSGEQHLPVLADLPFPFFLRSTSSSLNPVRSASLASSIQCIWQWMAQRLRTKSPLSTLLNSRSPILFDLPMAFYDHYVAEAASLGFGWPKVYSPGVDIWAKLTCIKMASYRFRLHPAALHWMSGLCTVSLPFALWSACLPTLYQMLGPDIKPNIRFNKEISHQ